MHPGLPWAGCAVLAAPAAVLLDVRRTAAAAGDVMVYGMPASAHTDRVYADYLPEMAHRPSTALDPVCGLTSKLDLLA